MSQERDTVNRRQALGVLGAAAGVAAFGDARPLAAAWLVRPAGFRPACIVTPAQTEGPYFVDEKLERRGQNNEVAERNAGDEKKS